MANEPKINLVQVSSRIDVVDHAKLMHECKILNQNPAEYIRALLHLTLAATTLTEEEQKSVDEKIAKAVEKRQAKRGKRRGFFRKLFGK